MNKTISDEIFLPGVTFFRPCHMDKKQNDAQISPLNYTGNSFSFHMDN